MIKITHNDDEDSDDGGDVKTMVAVMMMMMKSPWRHRLDGLQSGGFWLQENTPFLALELYRHGWSWCTVADSLTGANILTFCHQSDPTTILIPEAVCLARLFV
ncbi:hypothetical protein PoB_003490100 [Plakobranchus ocellatus]|uniref:Uncharacterized protein n=1 Tax=Plakobranchus ocellatus TaxID=259542 RepID=A0AAV4AB60_9GAST|nr:hypothetical protein PoB_003490100 [Plakobranchus ocellatus]